MIMMFVLHIGHRENFQMKLRRKYFLGFDVIYCYVPCRQSAILLYYNFILCAFVSLYFMWCLFDWWYKLLTVCIITIVKCNISIIQGTNLVDTVWNNDVKDQDLWEEGLVGTSVRGPESFLFFCWYFYFI